MINPELPSKQRPLTLYEQVSERIRNLITEGTLQPGDRLPSVRKLHQQLSVSVSTILEAYRLLEDQGWISARPQSGYYVKQVLTQAPEEPSQLTLLHSEQPVEISLAYRVYASKGDSSLIQLGAAIPSTELFPVAALNRLMGQVIRSQPQLVHNYEVPSGCEALRHQVARRLMEAGCSLSPNEIVITNGTTEALSLSLQAVTQPGDTVAIESPAYYNLIEVLNALHLKVLELPTHPQEGVSLPALESALQRDQISACVLVANFNNPLGSCMSSDKKRQLVKLFSAYDIPLIEDDIYGDLNFEGTRPKALKAFDTSGIVLYCASVSKTLSPGLRIGWSAPGRYQSKIEILKMSMNLSTAPIPQLTVAAFLSNGGYDRHLRHIRRVFQLQIAQMTQAICSYFPSETKVTRPKGGFILWLQFPDNFDALALYEEALSHGITIAPGVMFSPSGNYRNCLRLNCGLPWSPRIDQAMQTLGHLCKRQLAKLYLAAEQ
ncbi:aminotransferase-like domain-containing protein [Lyngbya confervoides]|uniref:PLP-dependent aminotransferase family protein n=1 Tax=Lyngbya confervoides BDU141951 TaxID=1574623 RepID=A0ABD4T629_9CYAN|nr:PLP-dependent aminotransferase family protein [Lyngbya confervoides]MCM1983893.1 PLP-dependent aminotransferase family protein [Lyngbya confervoides BDU141951]